MIGMQRSPLKCLAPVIGIFAGSMFGWFLHFIIQPSPAADVAARVFMVVFGVFGWAATALIDGRKLHCGATEKIDPETRHRYRWQAPVVLCLVCTALALLCTQRWYPYYGCMFVLFTCFIGEVGWGKPFQLYVSIATIRR